MGNTFASARRPTVCVGPLSESPAARRCISLRVLDHDLQRGRRTLTSFVPSGKGSFRPRYAFIATALPKMIRSSLTLPASRDGATACHCRYPSGIVTANDRRGEGVSRNREQTRQCQHRTNTSEIAAAHVGIVAYSESF